MWILLAGRNLEGLYFRKRRLSGTGSWQEQAGGQTEVHYLAKLTWISGAALFDGELVEIIAGLYLLVVC